MEIAIKTNPDTKALDAAQEKADKLLETLREVHKLIGSVRITAEDVAEEFIRMMAEAQKLYDTP